jgi:NAD(P)-dependent dehydrogenase (short-subunit alcohol dehydrogenase family)
MPGNGACCASKAAVEAAADTIAIENAPFGIDVTIVQPAGAYPTKLQSNGLRYFEEMLATLPESNRPRIAAFEKQIAEMREETKPDESLDPQEVVDGIVGLLLALERGDRPRRLVVGPFTEAVASLNDAHDRLQAMLAEDKH